MARESRLADTTDASPLFSRIGPLDPYSSRAHALAYVENSAMRPLRPPSTWYAQLIPLDCWLAALAQGWRLPFVVEPAGGHHRHYSILLTREDEPRGGVHRTIWEGPYTQPAPRARLLEGSM